MSGVVVVGESTQFKRLLSVQRRLEIIGPVFQIALPANDNFATRLCLFLDASAFSDPNQSEATLERDRYANTIPEQTSLS